jgi:F-type H+-transporting ATPase subunit b
VLIDWFTVGAQIINFLVLVGLLKYFLYGRIVRAMREREEKIAARLAEAEAREQEAGQELESYQLKNQELSRQRDQMLARAREEAEAERKKLLHEARQDVDRAKSRWYEAVEREKEAFLADLRQRASHQVFAIARLALADLASADLEERIIQAFSQRLEDLDEDKRQTLRASLRADQGVVITSAFDLPETAKTRIAEILQKHTDNGVKLDYRTSPAVISGIELRVSGYKVAWSLNDYLETLEEDLQETLEAKI